MDTAHVVGSVFDVTLDFLGTLEAALLADAHEKQDFNHRAQDDVHH